MKKYIAQANPQYRALISVAGSDGRDESFSMLWQQKRFREALDSYFPKQWAWFGDNLKHQTVCDNTRIAGFGEAFSERAFAVINTAFPEETKLNHPIELDGYKFIWVSPPVVERVNFELTPFNFFLAKPLYQSAYSEAFVDVWKAHGLVGHEFIETNQPRFLPKW